MDSRFLLWPRGVNLFGGGGGCLAFWFAASPAPAHAPSGLAASPACGLEPRLLFGAPSLASPSSPLRLVVVADVMEKRRPKLRRSGVVQARRSGEVEGGEDPAGGRVERAPPDAR